MIKNLPALLAAALLLAACAGSRDQQSQRIQEGWARAHAIAGECRTRRLAGELPGHVASAQCSNDGMRQAIAGGGYPYMDLVNVYLARRLVVAERVDAGEISESQGNAEIAEVYAAMSQQSIDRDMAAQSAHNAFTSAYFWFAAQRQQQQYQQQLL